VGVLYQGIMRLTFYSDCEILKRISRIRLNSKLMNPKTRSGQSTGCTQKVYLNEVFVPPRGQRLKKCGDSREGG
jgi:hypothetical protein